MKITTKRQLVSFAFLAPIGFCLGFFMSLSLLQWMAVILVLAPLPVAFWMIVDYRKKKLAEAHAVEQRERELTSS
jgi:FtsH-binding integral membrane protein